MDIDDRFLNTNETLHGGIIASLLDTASAATIRSSRKVRLATLTLTTNFMKPVYKGKLFATGRVSNNGNKVQFVEAHIFKEEGVPLSTSQGTFYIIETLKN